MDPRDDDIDLDFFGDDEPATTEAQPTQRVRLPRRGGRGGGGGLRRPSGPTRGFTPLLRLLAVIAILVALLVFFGLLLQSCASTSKHDSYQHYMDKVATIAKSSEDNGSQVGEALTTPGTKTTDLVTKLRGIAEQERQNVKAAQDLDPPGPLRTQHLHMIDALQLRVSGITCLANVFEQNASSKSSDAAALLVDQANRLLASDVVWDDFFRAPANTIMKDNGVTGVSAADSNFVANQEFITEHSMSLVLQRLQGATTGGTPTGIHGTNIVKTVAMPANQELSTTTLNTVTATTDLAFAVTVHNGGDSQEVGIKVTLTIDKQGGAIVKTKTIQVINPGQDRVVTFSDLGGVPFARNTHVDVDVAPVPGEKDATNNKASYPVIFSLG